jgi:signal peptidase I
VRSRPVRSWLAVAASFVVVAAAWLVFGPIGFGGSTGYTFIVGTSMEPKLHRGDLVLVRSGGDYRVGDVVAYQSRALKRTVLHRIVSIKGDRFVFKGDANDFLDPGPIVRSDLLGSYWLTVGGAAPMLEWVRVPWHSALFAGGLVLLLFGGGTGVAVSRRRRRAVREQTPKPRPVRSGSDLWQPLAVTGGLLLLAAAAAAAVAFRLPPTRSVPVARLYTQSGTFFYDASAPRGPAYPSGRVRSGDSVFLRVVHRVRVGFDWTFASEAPHGVTGTASLAADVTDGAGWTRRLVLVPKRTFTGDQLRLAGTLDLDALQRTLRHFETATGTHAGSYQLSLVPEISVGGVVAGNPLDADFQPSLQFTLDQLRFALAASTDPAKPNGLAREQTVGGSRTAPNVVSFLGHGAAIERTKLGSGVAALLALALLGLALVLRRRGSDEDDAEATIRRHGRAIVRVTHEPTRPHVDVVSVEELAHVAERYDRLILHCERTDSYFVEEDGISYRWRRLPAWLDDRLHERRDYATRPFSLPPGEPPDDVEAATLP